MKKLEKLGYYFLATLCFSVCLFVYNEMGQYDPTWMKIFGYLFSGYALVLGIDNVINGNKAGETE